MGKVLLTKLSGVGFALSPPVYRGLPCFKILIVGVSAIIHFFPNGMLASDKEPVGKMAYVIWKLTSSLSVRRTGESFSFLFSRWGNGGPEQGNESGFAHPKYHHGLLLPNNRQRVVLMVPLRALRMLDAPLLKNCLLNHVVPCLQTHLWPVLVLSRRFMETLPVAMLLS